MLFLLSFLFIHSALATCSNEEFGEFRQIQAIEKVLNKDNFVKRPDAWKSPCKNNPPTEAEMLQYLATLNTGKIKKKKITGVELKDDEGLLKLFGQLHNKDPKYDKEPWRYAKGTDVQIPPHCKDVLCAVKTIYGDELGVQLLYMRSKFGFNASHLAVGYVDGDPWPSKDLGTVLAMMNDFPAAMHPVKDGLRFIHTNANGRGGHKMIAEALVHVYTGWHNLPESEKTTSLAHEVGHLFADGRHDTPEWQKLSDWSSFKNEKGETVWKMGKPEAAVLEYARTNPNEDFGETFFMYRYNGKDLKKQHPEKYQYMKDNVFHGAEFDSHETCQ